MRTNPIRRVKVKSDRTRLRLMLILGVMILVVISLLLVLNAGGSVFAVGPLPPSQESVGQLAPTWPPPLNPPPPGTGFIPLPVHLSHLKGDRMPEGVSAAALLSSWDWRQQGVVTQVQNQGNCGACYAFASLANFESRLQIDGAGIYDFSENNAKECPWHDPSCGGGNYWEMAGWFSQKGAVLEVCDPYVENDVNCNDTCPHVKTLLDWRFISYEVPNPDVLKAYIQTHGPVYASMYVGDLFDMDWRREFSDYDGSYTLHYEGVHGPNHAVLIVGWDDGLPHAGGTGGWIVKNSWGADWGGACGYGSEGGYFTIAYGSAGIGQNSSFIHAWQDYDPDGGIMLYDEVGLTTGLGCPSSTTAWGLCKFIPPSGTYVTRVEFYTTDATTDVDVYIFDDFDGMAPSDLLWSSVNYSFAEAGYHGVEVDPPLVVTDGNDVIAVIKFTNDRYQYPIPADSQGPHETQRTYFSCDGSSGSWYDVGAGYQYDVAIRLRTSGALPPTPTPTVTPTATPTSLHSKTYLPICLREYPPYTPTPTSTTTPTIMPTATPTGTPTPTLPPPGVHVLENHSYHVDAIGYLHIVGEVKNNTVDHLRYVKITANIFNSSGQTIDTNFTYIYLGNLPAGDKTCFDILLEEPSDWSYYEFEPPDYWTDGEPLPDLTILNDSGSYYPIFGWYEVVGQVRNDHATRVEYVRPVGTLYNASYTVIGCNFTFIDDTHLDPDQISSFRMTFLGRDYADAAAYRLQVDGNPQQEQSKIAPAF